MPLDHISRQTPVPGSRPAPVVTSCPDLSVQASQAAVEGPLTVNPSVLCVGPCLDSPRGQRLPRSLEPLPVSIRLTSSRDSPALPTGLELPQMGNNIQDGPETRQAKVLTPRTAPAKHLWAHGDARMLALYPPLGSTESPGALFAKGKWSRLRGRRNSGMEVGEGSQRSPPRAQSPVFSSTWAECQSQYLSPHHPQGPTQQFAEDKGTGLCLHLQIRAIYSRRKLFFSRRLRSTFQGAKRLQGHAGGGLMRPEAFLPSKPSAELLTGEVILAWLNSRVLLARFQLSLVDPNTASSLLLDFNKEQFPMTKFLPQGLRDLSEGSRHTRALLPCPVSSSRGAGGGGGGAPTVLEPSPAPGGARELEFKSSGAEL